jgi:hypothetical protein
MWLTIKEFKDRSKISILSDDEVVRFLQIARNLMKEWVFQRQIKTLNTWDKNNFRLPLYDLYLADYLSYDGIITKDDIRVYERHKAFDITYELNEHILEINKETGMVVMDNSFPTVSDNILTVEYFLGRFRWEDMYEDIKLLQTFFTLREMMTERPIAAQAVMSNNVTIAGFSFGSGSGDLESNRNNVDFAIKQKIKELQPLRFRARGDMVHTNPYMSLKL